MCGRFERHSALSEFSKIVAGLVAEGIDPLPPSYNIAPSQVALVVRHQTSAHRVDLLTLGLVPDTKKPVVSSLVFDSLTALPSREMPPDNHCETPK